MKLHFSHLLAVFSGEERRKNSRADQPVPDEYVRQYARLRKTLVDISNMTRRDMPDAAEFRVWAQDQAHEAIVNTRMIP